MEDNEYTIDISSIDAITLTGPVNPSIGDITWDTGSNTLNVYTDSSVWTTISDVDTIDLSRITFDRVMFEDNMPDPQELKRMCEEYPGLEKAYENFKTVYKMVEQDWRGKQDDDSETLF